MFNGSAYTEGKEKENTPTADTRYIDLEHKIESAKHTDFTIISRHNNTLVLSYYEHRLKIIEQYYNINSIDNEKTKRYLLDLFENCNENIKTLLGL